MVRPNSRAMVLAMKQIKSRVPSLYDDLFLSHTSLWSFNGGGSGRMVLNMTLQSLNFNGKAASSEIDVIDGMSAVIGRTSTAHPKVY